jgi:hypothetical protein
MADPEYEREWQTVEWQTPDPLTVEGGGVQGSHYNASTVVVALLVVIASTVTLWLWKRVSGYVKLRKKTKEEGEKKRAQRIAFLATLPHEAAAAHKRRAAAAAVKAGTQQCAHEFVSQFADQPIGCDCCWKPTTDPERLAAETAKMEAAVAEDGTGEAHADFLWSRAVTVAWLVGFTNRYHCWDWTTAEVQAFIVKPDTEATRQRYADLPHVRAAAGVGPADVMVSRK